MSTVSTPSVSTASIFDPAPMEASSHTSADNHGEEVVVVPPPATEASSPSTIDIELDDNNENVEGEEPTGDSQKSPNDPASDPGGAPGGDQDHSSDSSMREDMVLHALTPNAWNDLRVVHVTRRSIAELERRQGPRKYKNTYVSDLRHFARRGGPDLSHLWGGRKDLGPASVLDHGLGNLADDGGIGANPRKKRRVLQESYDENFLEYLNQHKMFIHDDISDNPPEAYPGSPANIAEIRQQMLMPLPEENRITEHDWEQFYLQFHYHDTRHGDYRAFEAVVKTDLGHGMNEEDFRHHSWVRFPWKGLKTLAAPDPDLCDFDRAPLGHLQLKMQLNDILSPYVSPERPVLTNFFFESDELGDEGCGRRKTLYQGSCGAMTMEHMRSLGLAQSPTEYAGRAMTFSAVFTHPHLCLYAHHVTGVYDLDDPRPVHHMTLLERFNTTTTFLEAATGLQGLFNLNRLAREYRESLLEAAKSQHPDP